MPVIFALNCSDDGNVENVKTDKQEKKTIVF